MSRKHLSMTLVNVSAGSKYLTADEANGNVCFNATFLRDYLLDTLVWHLPACLFWVLLAFAFWADEAAYAAVAESIFHLRHWELRVIASF
jgi:hypothetical protein